MTEHSSSDTDERPRFRYRRETEEIDVTDQPYGIYRCHDCNNIVLTMQDTGEAMTCHGEPMVPITDWEMDVNPPDLREVLLDAFGLPKMGLDVCLCVIGEGPLSPGEVADTLDYEESTVRTYLNKLVDIGLLTKSQLNREDGGFVNVYHSVDLEKMRRETLVGFYIWAGEAATLIERANLTKQDYQNSDAVGRLDEIFWEEFETNGER